jgi:hypothetical protein
MSALRSEGRVSFRNLVRAVDQMPGEGIRESIESLLGIAGILGVKLLPGTQKKLEAFFEHRARRERERYVRHEQARLDAMTPEERARHQRICDMLAQSSKRMQELMLRQVFNKFMENTPHE